MPGIVSSPPLSSALNKETSSLTSAECVQATHLKCASQHEFVEEVTLGNTLASRFTDIAPVNRIDHHASFLTPPGACEPLLLCYPMLLDQEATEDKSDSHVIITEFDAAGVAAAGSIKSTFATVAAAVVAAATAVLGAAAAAGIETGIAPAASTAEADVSAASKTAEGEASGGHDGSCRGAGVVISNHEADESMADDSSDESIHNAEHDKRHTSGVETKAAAAAPKDDQYYQIVQGPAHILQTVTGLSDVQRQQPVTQGLGTSEKLQCQAATVSSGARSKLAHSHESRFHSPGQGRVAAQRLQLQVGAALASPQVCDCWFHV